jgi:hypothetical protein
MLYGRETELAELTALLERSRDGIGGTLVLRGEEGVGKTALLQHIVDVADGLTVIRSAGQASESELKFAGLHLLLHPHLHLLDRLSEPHAAALRGALSLGQAAVQERYVLGLGLVALLSDLAAHAPLLCLIDDAQWVDHESIDAVLFASRHLERAPITFVFATRDDHSPLHAARLPELALHRLDRVSSARLLAAHADQLTAYARDRIADEAEGNPLALLELAAARMRRSIDRHAQGLSLNRTLLPHTSRARQTVRQHMSALPEPAQALLAVIATDDTGDLAVVLTAAERFGGTLADLARIEQRRLIMISDGHVRFRHPLTRAAAYAEVPTAQRLAVHRVLAETLDGDANAEQRAAHLAEATMRPDESVAAHLEQSAQLTRLHGGCAEAAAAYERAARLTPDRLPRSRRLARAARAALDAGRPEWVAELMNRSFTVTADPWAQAELTRVAAVTAVEKGNLKLAHDLLMEAVRLVEGRRPRAAAALLLEAMRVALAVGDETLIEQTAGQAAPLDCSTDAEARSFVAATTGLRDLFMDADHSGVIALRTLMATLGAQTSASDLREWNGVVPLGLYTGDVHGMHALAESLAGHCRVHGAVGLLPSTLLTLARAQILLGKPREALANASEGLELALEASQGQIIGGLQTCLVHLAALQGDEERCRSLAAEVLARQTAVTDAWCHMGLSLLELGLGNYEAALCRGEDLESNPAWRTVAFYGHLTKVEAAVRLGASERAVRSLRRFEEWAAATEQPWARAVALRDRALLASKEDAGPLY